jgi:DNA-directed RNA polymerase subunit RPC12/RpoP
MSRQADRSGGREAEPRCILCGSRLVIDERRDRWLIRRCASCGARETMTDPAVRAFRGREDGDGRLRLP